MRLSSLETVFLSLNAAHIKYLVAGGVAVIAHGYVRFTQDLDLVIGLDHANLTEALRALERLGYRPRVPVAMADFADPEKRAHWIRAKNMIVFQLISDAHATVPIDIFVSEPFVFDEEYRQMMPYQLQPGLTVPVVSLNTLIEMKQEASRPNDLQDIRMLNRQLPNHPKP